MASDTREKMQRAIADLRSGVPGCDLALVADAATGLVLHAESGGAALPHDALERVAETALADLNAPWTSAIAERDAPLDAARLDADGWTVALRPAGGEEILVCRCTDAPDRAALASAAGAVFDTLSGAEGA